MMRNLLISVGLMGLVAGLLFTIIWLIVEDAHVAEGVAALPFTASHSIAEILERQQTRNTTQTDKISYLYSVEGFVRPWYIMSIYGALVIAGVSGFISFLVGVIAGIVDAGPSNTQILLGLVAVPILLLTAFRTGVWIGARVSNRGVLSAMVASIAGILVVRIFDVFVWGMIGDAGEWSKIKFDPHDLSNLLGLGIMLLILSIAGIVGNYIGRKKQSSRYMIYLLKLLPDNTKSDLLTLASEEAQRIATKRGVRLAA